MTKRFAAVAFEIMTVFPSFCVFFSVVLCKWQKKSVSKLKSNHKYNCLRGLIFNDPKPKSCAETLRTKKKKKKTYTKPSWSFLSAMKAKCYAKCYSFPASVWERKRKKWTTTKKIGIEILVSCHCFWRFCGVSKLQTEGKILFIFSPCKGTETLVSGKQIKNIFRTKTMDIVSVFSKRTNTRHENIHHTQKKQNIKRYNEWFDQLIQFQSEF